MTIKSRETALPMPRGGVADIMIGGRRGLREIAEARQLTVRYGKRILPALRCHTFRGTLLKEKTIGEAGGRRDWVAR